MITMGKSVRQICFSYKEMQINILNATWDLLVKKPYIDTDCLIRREVGDEQCPPDEEKQDSSWFSGQVKKVYTDGGINDPNQKGNTPAVKMEMLYYWVN